jgi:hypothetical protein
MDLTTFLRQLDERRVPYRLDRVRDGTMVIIGVPGERWEIEFMDDGEIEIERFRSNGEIGDERWLEELWPLTD